MTEYVNTKEMARMLSLKQQTIRNRIHSQGSYFGIKPYKTAAGRLTWKRQEIIDFLEGKTK